MPRTRTKVCTNRGYIIWDSKRILTSRICFKFETTQPILPKKLRNLGVSYLNIIAVSAYGASCHMCGCSVWTSVFLPSESSRFTCFCNLLSTTEWSFRQTHWQLTDKHRTTGNGEQTADSSQLTTSNERCMTDDIWYNIIARSAVVVRYVTSLMITFPSAY